MSERSGQGARAASSTPRQSRRSGPSRSSAAPQPTRAYLQGARILSIGIAATGLLTFAYFSIASHVLGAGAAKRIDVLWSVMFVIISVIYRPVEQLLSRTIAAHRALGEHRPSVTVPLAIQGLFALVFLALALALRGELVRHVFDHSSALFWVLVMGTLAYAASYFARGWLAGHQRFGLFGGLVLMESCSRLCFALAVAVGIASGQTTVALGIAAAPLLSLVVVPAAFARMGRGDGATADPQAPWPTADEAEAALAGPATEAVQERAAHPGTLSMRHGTRFALAVSAIMLSEQTLLNAAVLTVAVTASGAALAGIVFNVMLIARAPLQLFQAVQTTLLPHLTGLEVNAGQQAFGRAVRLTVLCIAAFAAVVAVGLLAVGPEAMEHALFGQRFTYGRLGLAAIGVAMGMHLASGTLNQAALARGRAGAAAACWLVAAAAFVGWMLSPAIHAQLPRAEVGYLGATTLLAALLAGLYRRGPVIAGASSMERTIAP